MLSLGADLEERDLNKRPLAVPELLELMAGHPVEKFLSTRNEVYRLRELKDNPPGREEAAALIAEHPNLLRRPVTQRGQHVVLGCDEEHLRRLAEQPRKQ